MNILYRMTPTFSTKNNTNNNNNKSTRVSSVGRWTRTHSGHGHETPTSHRDALTTEELEGTPQNRAGRLDRTNT